jgi:glutaminyl-peptide cyclotransferase
MIARLAALLLLWSAGARAEIGWTIVRTLPHDATAFTQGLFIADGLLYESTGLVGRSELRAMRLSDGKIVRRKAIDPSEFGEGIAPWRDQLLSLTWKSGRGFVWDRATFRQIGSFSYSGEGWGFTSDGKRLIMSDGTSGLRFLDPKTQQPAGTVTVRWEGSPVRNLNELEWVDGSVFANIWYSPLIARIDPASGTIDDWINLAPLVAKHAVLGSDAVLNGIAWDSKARQVYVTGKNWPLIYVLRLAK